MVIKSRRLMMSPLAEVIMKTLPAAHGQMAEIAGWRKAA
jgi:hypothetical protein